MNVSYTDKDDHFVNVQIECDSRSAELIFALITPIIYDADVLQISQALPEALVRLALRIELARDWEEEVHWNRTSSELVSTFISSMRDFRERLSVNWTEWAEKFVDHFWEMFASIPDEENNKSMFAVFNAVIEQVKAEVATNAQQKVYLSPSGLPYSFEEWAERISGEEISDDVLASAHFGLLNVNKLREVIHSWKNRPSSQNISF